MVVDGVRKIQAGGSTEGQDHQDLWQEVERELHRLGPDRIQVRKVKAHLTEEQVDAGYTPRGERSPMTKDEWHLNEEVDGLAKIGAELHNRPLTRWTHAKRRRRVTVIIQRMQVAILKERAPLLEAVLAEQRKEPHEVVDSDSLPPRPEACKCQQAPGWDTWCKRGDDEDPNQEEADAFANLLLAAEGDPWKEGEEVGSYAGEGDGVATAQQADDD